MNKILFIGLWVLTTSVACGMSPQFNHGYPDRTIKQKYVSPNGCDFELRTQNLCASLTWIKEPTRDDEGEFLLKFWNNSPVSSSAGPFINPANVNPFVKLWMPAMGHGSQKVILTQAQDSAGQSLTGVFRASSVFFVMGGAWEIILQLKDSAGTVVDSGKISYSAE